jgi:hypothetical protein
MFYRARQTILARKNLASASRLIPKLSLNQPHFAHHLWLDCKTATHRLWLKTACRLYKLPQAICLF